MTVSQLNILVRDELEPFLTLGDPSVHLPVRLDVLSEHEIYVGDDGGLAGLFLATRFPSTVGTPLTLDVRLPWGETMVVEGKVDWVWEASRTTLRVRQGMGLKFIELLPQEQTLLNRALLLREPMTVPADVRRA